MIQTLRTDRKWVVVKFVDDGFDSFLTYHDLKKLAIKSARRFRKSEGRGEPGQRISFIVEKTSNI